MELRIDQLIQPEQIKFNYVELKRYVMEGAEKYKNIVYTDDDIGTAKQDRADLNRLKKALNDRRIQIEREYTKPLTEFKDKINEIIRLIDEPAKLIDERVKEYEQAKKDEKAQQIREHFESIEDRPEWLEIGQIWDSKWLNASKSMKSIKEEIQTALDGIRNDLATLAEIADFGFEATEVYKSTLDINKALAEGMRLSEIQKMKAAEEARKAEEAARRAEEERQQKLDAIINNPTSQIINAAEAREEAERQAAHYPCEPAPQPEVWQQERAVWVNFSALITTTQGRALKEFMDSNGIQFRPLPQ